MNWTQPAFQDLARLINQRTGLALGTRPDSAELGMRRAMEGAKVKDPADYLNLIQASPAALDALVNELTVGETFFFREPAQFQIIRREVLPDIVNRRGPQHLVRAWSAACASGEEAYSLAILFEQENIRAHLLATDISQKALAKARQAVYGEWSLRGEGKSALPYLEPERKQYRVTEKIRRKVNFEYLNLALDVYPAMATGTWGMDLILCRNVLIYFDPETVCRVAQRLYQSLVEGGWLLTAAADPPLWDRAPFEVVSRDEGLFYRRPRAAAVSFEPSPAPVALEEASAFVPANEVEEVNVPAQASPLETPVEDTHDRAQKSFAQGDYVRAAALSADHGADPALAVLHIRALANLGVEEAEAVCARAVTQFPLAAELYFLHAVLLMDQERAAEATQALRRALYLDRSLAIAHFTLASLLRRQGDLDGARRAYRNARDLCATLPAEQSVPLADGEPAGRLAEAADVELSLLDSLAGAG